MSTKIVIKFSSSSYNTYFMMKPMHHSLLMVILTWEALDISGVQPCSHLQRVPLDTWVLSVMLTPYAGSDLSEKQEARGGQWLWGCLLLSPCLPSFLRLSLECSTWFLVSPLLGHQRKVWKFCKVKFFSRFLTFSCYYSLGENKSVHL